MARAWVADRWVKDATVTMPDGSAQRLSPTAEQLKALRTLPEYFRTEKYGKGTRWAVRWYEPVAGGERRQRELRFKRRGQADQFAAELEDDIRSGRYVDPAHREKPFREVAEKWLSAKKRIKDATWLRYRRELDNYVLPRWGETRVGEIQADQVRDWVDQLAAGTAPYDFSVNHTPAEGQLQKRKPRKPAELAPSYVRHLVKASFGGPLRFAMGERWITENPLARVDLPRDEIDLENDLPRLSFEEIEMLAAAAEDLTGSARDRVLLHVLAFSGPRIGEATALKIKDLDLDNKQARIHRTWTVDKQGRRKLGPVKTWQKRWIPLAGFIVDDLRELIDGRDPEAHVFATDRGTAVDGKNWYNRVWKKITAETGLALAYSVHDLRHVAATLAIAAGADVKLVQRMLGHKDANETLNTYAHLWPERVAEVIDLVERRRAAALAAAADEARPETSAPAA